MIRRLGLGRTLVAGALVGSAALATVVWAQDSPASPQGGAAPAASQAGPSAVPGDEVVLTVGNTKITAAEFDKIIANLPPQYSGAVAGLGKRGFADQYGNLLGLAQEGEKLKVDQREEFRQMLAFQRMLMLAQVTLNEAATSTAVSPEESRYYYTAHQAEFEEAQLRGIYIPFDPETGATTAESSSRSPGTQAPSAGGPAGGLKPKLKEVAARAKAETLRTRIQNGEDIATLAKTESEHPTASKGGDFGFVRRNQFAPEIDNAVFALKVKQVSAPLRDRFGFFLFQLEGKRVQPFEEAQPTIENNLRQQKVMDFLNHVKTSYPVTMNPRYFPEAPPTLGTPVPPSAGK